uniref:G-protein coupled receptors family 1 profile domain-containing protein n=1 Tax=Acrobeloides nanus TaxID=290746 RepID=A0A914CHT1_9BILA
MTNKNLRKEKVIVIYLANILYDAFFTLGFVSAGIFRLNLHYNESNIFYNPWICFNTVQAYFWIIFTPATGLIVLTSALDRLISVTYPLKYRCWNKRYMICISLLPFVLSIPFWVFIGIQSYTIGDQYKVPVSCNILNGDMPGLSYHLRSIRLASSFIAILLYLPILYKIYELTMKTSIPKTNTSEQKKLLRSTLTIGLFAANELMSVLYA